MEKKLLTISILVSGRKETKKCLDSVKPILEQIPSELILTDTGCDEKTLALCKEYTDQIIPFTWCNDFAKARNVGLKAASAEWFLYLDDDEWFEDPTEIIEFFKSGEYKNYQYAFYMQRNYSDYQENSYTDSPVSRMIRLRKDTAFQGAVHEVLSPLKEPAKYFRAYVKHFGYIFQNEQQRQEHSRRNAKLLLEMTKREPLNLRWDIHLLQEYMFIEEYSKLVETAEKGIEKCHKLQKVQNCSRDMGTIYAYLAEGYGHKFDNEQQRKTIERGLREPKQTRLAKTYLYRCAVFLNFRTEQYEKCLTAFEKYMQGYEKLGSDQKAMAEQGCLILDMTFDHNNFQHVLLFGIMSAAKTGNDEVIKKYFFDLGWEDKKMLLHPDFTELVIRRMPEMDDTETCVSMARTLAERDGNTDAVVLVLQMLRNEFRKQDAVGEEKWKCIVNIFSQVQSEHWYFLYLKILAADQNGDAKVLQQLYETLFQRVVDIFNLDHTVWAIAEKNKVSMEPLFLQIDFDKWRNGISNWIASGKKEEILEKTRMMHAWKKTNDIRYDYFEMKTKEALLRHCGKENAGFEVLEQALSDFTEAELGFYGKFIKKTTFTSYPEILPPDCRFAVKARKAISYRESGKEQEVVDTLREMIDVYPPLNDVLRQYTVKFGEARKKQKNSAVNAEMQELGEQLKEKARQLMDTHAFGMAQGILEQLAGFLPDDEQCRQMLQECKEKAAQ